MALYYKVPLNVLVSMANSQMYLVKLSLKPSSMSLRNNLKREMKKSLTQLSCLFWTPAAFSTKKGRNSHPMKYSPYVATLNTSTTKQGALSSAKETQVTSFM